jgi:molybdopterin biosynthesis enzyme
VSPAKGQGSHELGGLAAADCLIHFPVGSTLLQAGEIVTVELLSWTA